MLPKIGRKGAFLKGFASFLDISCYFLLSLYKHHSRHIAEQSVLAIPCTFSGV